MSKQRLYLDLFTAAGGIVFGRRLYQQYVGHREVARDDITAETELELHWAQRLIDMQKFVLSNTLTDPGSNATVLDGDADKELTSLKQQPGGNLPRLVPLRATDTPHH